MMEAQVQICLACGKTIKGRTDKKFCDDYCRNSYNNKLNSDQNNYVRNINNILRKNRRILQQHLGVETTKKIRKDKLSELGFNFEYHTHHYQTQKQQSYIFNYEFGYLVLDAVWILLVQNKHEIK